MRRKTGKRHKREVLYQYTRAAGRDTRTQSSCILSTRFIPSPPVQLPRVVLAVFGLLGEQVYKGQHQPLVRKHGFALVEAVALLGRVAYYITDKSEDKIGRKKICIQVGVIL